MSHYARLEWAVKNINAVPTGGPVLTLNGKRPVFGPCAGKRCSCRVRPFSASQGAE